MEELANSDLIYYLIEYDEDFDPYHDKQSHQDLIRALMAHCNITMTNRCLDFDADMLGGFEELLANRLVKYSDAYDHYDFEDAYSGDMEAAIRDVINSLVSAKSTEEILQSLVDDYVNLHGVLPEDLENDVNETFDMIDEYIKDGELEGGISQCDIPEKIEDEVEDSIEDGLDYTE